MALAFSRTSFFATLAKLNPFPKRSFSTKRTQSMAYAHEERVAIAAVRRACVLTSKVFETLIKNETLVKGDKSPVTGEPDNS